MMHWKSILVLVVVGVGLCTGAPSKETIELREKRDIEDMRVVPQINTTVWWPRAMKRFKQLAENFTKIQEILMNVTTGDNVEEQLRMNRLQQLIDRWQSCSQNPLLCLVPRIRLVKPGGPTITVWVRRTWYGWVGEEITTPKPAPMEKTMEVDDSTITGTGLDLGDLGVDLTRVDPYGILPDDSASEE